MARILVVDDLAVNRAVVALLLRYEHHEVDEARDGVEALAVVQRQRPDLVITDVLMPGMDGYELVRQLRLDPATADIPVVFYTAHYAEREARDLAVSAGVADVLTKPIEPEVVLRVVGRILSAGSSAAPSPVLSADFDRQHLRLITDKLSDQDRDLRTANARLRALVNIGLELASERDSKQLLRSVCDSSAELLGATYVTLGIVDRVSRTVERYVSRGVDAAAWIAHGEPVPGILGRVVNERRTIRGENHGGDPTALGLPPRHPLVQSYLMAPIASPEHVYGWLCLVANEGRAFDEDDEQLLRALSGQVGRIYETGYFYAIAQKRTHELEREVVERKQVEAALLAERNRAQRYLDTAEVILLALDLEGRVTLINRYGCSLLGWTAEQLLGRAWIETCLPARLWEPLRRKFAGMIDGDLSIVEHEVVDRNGLEHLVEWRNTVLRNESGTVIGTLSSGTDITARELAVEAVRTAEERMRFALESAEVGIWDMDYTSGVLRWSPTLEVHYGVQPGTFDGRFDSFVQRIHPDDRAAILEVIAKATQSGSDFQLDHRAIWPDGTVRWLNGAGRILLGPAGEPVRGVGISLDVTGRRALEQQYQQAQKMEAIGRLAGGVAHDFNNLLTAILGYCDLLLTDFSPADPRRADLIEIQQAGFRAAGLTRQLLAFSRKQIVEPTLLDLNLVVIDVRRMLERLIGEDVRIELGLADEPSPINADRGQVEQVILNLAVNARDAMLDGGRLTIETANVELDESDATRHFAITPGPYSALIVTDTGTGMTHEVQQRLFEPFFTTKGPGKGTGLGLATIHGIVMRSGGSIHVDSELGRGTSFKVYFPRALGDEVGGMAHESPAASLLGTQTVLLVEDAESLRPLTTRLLRRLGYTVLAAANPDEALDLFTRHGSVDIVLTDVVMPGASGPLLTEELVRQRPALKVIYMSSYTEETIVHHGVLNPGVAFLNKPFTSETLGRKLREALAS